MLFKLVNPLTSKVFYEFVWFEVAIAFNSDYTIDDPTPTEYLVILELSKAVKIYYVIGWFDYPSVKKNINFEAFCLP